MGMHTLSSVLTDISGERYLPVSVFIMAGRTKLLVLALLYLFGLRSTDWCMISCLSDFIVPAFWPSESCTFSPSAGFTHCLTPGKCPVWRGHWLPHF
jgi:hypothetical protein